MSQPRDQMQERGWDPIGSLQSLWSELGRVFGGDANVPEVELLDTDDGWRVVARLPGVAPEEVAVEIDGADLCLRGRSEQEVDVDNGLPGTGSTERGFEYRLRLPSGVDVHRMDAVMDHGLLTITMPRAEPGGRRSIVVGRPQHQQPTAGSAAARSGRAEQVRITTDGAGIAAEEIDPAIDREMHHPYAGEADVQRQQASTAR